MTKLSRVLFPVIILIIPTIIILNSCSKDNNLAGDECNIVIDFDMDVRIDFVTVIEL